VAYFFTGNYSEAVENWEKLIALYPNYEKRRELDEQIEKAMAHLQEESATLTSHDKAMISKPLESHPSDRREEQSSIRSESPKHLTIRILKDNESNFDIYRVANLSFQLTHQQSGKVHSSSRIDFKNNLGSVGMSSVTVIPGIYNIMLPGMMGTPGRKVQIRANDPEHITLSIILLPGGTVRMYKTRTR
jgi:hypothetical protein